MRSHPFSFGKKIEAGVIQEDVSRTLPFPAQIMNQVHGARIVEVESYGEPPEADALITRERGIRLMVKTADCIPIVIVDEIVPVVAAVHAGWRSLIQDIIPKTIEKMIERGAAPEDMLVGIGPSLGLECGEFTDPKKEIPEKYHWAIREGNKVDLKAIALKQLEDAGVSRQNISHMDICTKCDEEWFSWRRDKDSRRFGTWVGLV